MFNIQNVIRYPEHGIIYKFDNIRDEIIKYLAHNVQDLGRAHKFMNKLAL